MEPKTPVVFITNYQQYINADYLTEMLREGDDLKGSGGPLYASIAYVDVKKIPQPVKGQRLYNIILALSINGRTYTYKKLTDNPDFYLAKKGLDVNEYFTPAGKDNHIRVFQKAFETLVNWFVEKIAMDMALNK